MKNISNHFRNFTKLISMKVKPKQAKKKQFDNENNENKREGKISLKSLFKIERKEPNFILSIFVTTLRLFIILILIIGFAGFGAVVGVGKAYLDSTPELDVAQIEDQSETSFIYDKDGNLITEYYGYENRVWATIDEIPDMLKNAFIAIEDSRFYVHNGIDIKRLFGAVVHNLRNESVQGASTITQQLIKNTILTPEVSYKRKIQEMYLAIQLEKKYEKDEILEAYLNTIHLGGSNYGVKAAAKDYFGKELNELTLQECALLAGITKNPWRYDPRANFYDRNRPEWTIDRTNLVLSRMYETGFITKEQYEKAKIDSVEEAKNSIKIIEEPSNNDYPMKYFIEYVIQDVRNRLMEAKGWSGEEGRRKAEQYIYSGGLHIYTTLDPEIQKTVEEAVYNYKNYPKFTNSIYKISSQNIEQPQAAAVVIDQHTGELRAIVGGKQPPTGKRQYNRAFQGKLPLGSAIKPLSVYGPFIEMGYPGGIILENIPAPIDGWTGGKFPYPRNYDGGSFEGPTSVRRGIVKSLNVVAARIVLDRIGTKYSADKLRELGLTDVTEQPADLSLGTYGNNMIEVAGAYAAIANKGIYQEPISFTKVLDKDGNVILDTTSTQIKRVVFKESTAFILTEWMQDVVNGGTTTIRIKNQNGKSIKVAGKTGTNNEFKGVYFAGFTPYYTATVWIGHDDFQPSFVSGSTGGTFAAPLWKSFMEPIHSQLESVDFYEKVPDDVVRFTVCGVSGKRPNGTLCANDISGHGLVTEWFPKNAVPETDDICDMHVEIEVCAYSGKKPSPYCPAEHRVKKSVIVLPKDSPYQHLTDEELAKYLPGAVRDISVLEQLDYNNPEHQQYFCPLHTEKWFVGEQQREAMKIEASTLIAQTRAKLNTYESLLTQYQKDRLNEAIASLEAALDNGKENPPADGQDPSQGTIIELPIFNPSIVQEAMNYLIQLNNEIFGSIEAPPIEDDIGSGVGMEPTVPNNNPY